MSPQAEGKEIYEIMADYGLDRECVRPLVENLMANKDMWVKLSSLCFVESTLFVYMTLVYDGFRAEARKAKDFKTLDLSPEYGIVVLSRWLSSHDPVLRVQTSPTRYLRRPESLFSFF